MFRAIYKKIINGTVIEIVVGSAVGSAVGSIVGTSVGFYLNKEDENKKFEALLASLQDIAVAIKSQPGGVNGSANGPEGEQSFKRAFSKKPIIVYVDSSKKLEDCLKKIGLDEEEIQKCVKELDKKPLNASVVDSQAGGDTLHLSDSAPAPEAQPLSSNGYRKNGVA